MKWAADGKSTSNDLEKGRKVEEVEGTVKKRVHHTCLQEM